MLRAGRGFRRMGALSLVLAVTTGPVTLAGTSDEPNGPDDPAAVGRAGAMDELPDAAVAIMRSSPYRHARWSWHAVDLASGEELLGSGADILTLLGSTTKIITVASYYDAIGADGHLTTPVYAQGDIADGVLQGDLVLVGAGDFILGSRAATPTDVEFAEPDHVYWYIGPITEPVEADPLAGLDELARQVAAAGVRTVDGDVLVDDRLWDAYVSKEGVVTPIMVNDNLLDLNVAPGPAVGDAAIITTRPATEYLAISNEVTTVEAGDVAEAVVVTADDGGLVVHGQVSVDRDAFWTAYFAPDPAAYARALFIEALGRAGVTVSAPLTSAVSTLPARAAYDDADRIAELPSPPAHVLGRLILKVSHNRGAETFLCLLAVSTGSTDCDDGLAVMAGTVAAAGVDEGATFLVDGEGSDPSAATPRAITTFLRWAGDQPWADDFRLGMPDIGDDGTINAKSGTSAAPRPLSASLMLSTKAEAGYIETEDGLVAISLYTNGAIVDGVAGLQQSVADMGDILVAIGGDL